MNDVMCCFGAFTEKYSSVVTTSNSPLKPCHVKSEGVLDEIIKRQRNVQTKQETSSKTLRKFLRFRQSHQRLLLWKSTTHGSLFLSNALGNNKEN